MNRLLTAIASVSLFVACGGSPSSGTTSQSMEGLEGRPAQTLAAVARPAVAVPVTDGTAPSAPVPAPVPVPVPVPVTEGTNPQGNVPSPVVVPSVPALALHTNAADDAASWQSDFTISSTYDIYFATDLSGLPDGHYTLAVDVFMPGNGAYQTFTTYLAVGVSPMDGESAAVKTASGWRAWNRMPVAGTIIDQYSLAGPWTATAYLGDLQASAAFNLN